MEERASLMSCEGERGGNRCDDVGCVVCGWTRPGEELGAKKSMSFNHGRRLTIRRSKRPELERPQLLLLLTTIAGIILCRTGFDPSHGSSNPGMIGSWVQVHTSTAGYVPRH